MLVVKKMSTAPAIGIDLGTTFSCVSIYNNGKPEIINNKNGDRLTPSLVYYHPDSLEVSVGAAAYDLGNKCIKNFLFDIKRIIGRKYDDVYVQKLINSSQITFTIISGENEAAAVQITHDNVLVTKSPEQVCSEILRYLKESVEQYLDQKVTEAVISVPAYFNNAQRKATKAAAELAGLKLLKLVTEPVAAAIYYALDKIDTKSTLLVFDFGGGTLDVSIIKVTNQQFQVKAVEGDTIGGRDLDEILFDYFNEQLLKKYRNAVLPRWLPRRLKEKCIKLKQMLSTEMKYETSIECITGGDDDGFCLTLTREKFENLTSDIFARILEIVKLSLSENSVSMSDINKIVLVGGSSKIPKIHKILRSQFEDTEIKTDLNPDEAVAFGAGLQAALLKKQFKELEKVVITDITPLSLGISIKGDLMEVFISKATSLPVKTTKTLRTVNNNQINCSFPIYEGERTSCKYNNKLGSFVVEGLPKKRAGDINFDVTFSLNEDGILEVEAEERSRGLKNKLVVTMGEFRLCETQIGRSVKDALENKKEDRLFKEFILYQNESDEHIQHVLYELDNITSNSDKNLIEKVCNEFTAFSKNADFKNIDLFKRKFKKAKEDLTSTLSQYNILDYGEDFRCK